MSAALIDRIERDGRALSQKVLEEMYRDPFWTERYGDRGRRHADEDSDFHLRYLARALAAGDSGVLKRYAVWLREVLATRGMCTRHLDENFRLLAREIAAQDWPDAKRAAGFIGEAREALVFAPGEARSVQQSIDMLADEIARGFRSRRPQGWKRDARGEAGLREDAANYLSYVADALAFARPDFVAGHTRWLSAHVKSHGASDGDVSAFITLAREALGARDCHAAVVLLDQAVHS